MNLVPWKPQDNWLEPFGSLEREMENLFNRTSLRTNGKNRLRSLWNLNVDIYDEKTQIRVKADIPELEREDIDITAENGILTIKGEKREEKETREKDCVRSERYCGSFHRSFSLPSGADTQKVDATYKNGVLEVIIPKREVAKSQQVKIQVK